jgi:ABC-type multidrug transport system ATPase subunit
MYELTIDDISKDIQGRKILDSISLSFQDGVTGVIGPNGSGKSTLIKILSGLVKKNSGTVYFNNTELNLKSAFWRQQIGYLPQNPGLYDRMTLEEFYEYILILSGWRQHKKRLNQIDEIISELDLSKYTKDQMQYLSGGIRQRISIGQAIIHDPYVILLDEPTNSLDPDERIRFYSLLTNKYQNRLIIYADHLINDLNRICSKIVVLYNGRVVFFDESHSLIELYSRYIKQIKINLSETEKMKKFRILDKELRKEYFLVKYDKRFYDDDLGYECHCNLEDVYRVLLNSFCL